jgi:hypothetical protein
MEQKQGPSNRDVDRDIDTVTVPVSMINDMQAQLNHLNEAMRALSVRVIPNQ